MIIVWLIFYTIISWESRIYLKSQVVALSYHWLWSRLRQLFFSCFSLPLRTFFSSFPWYLHLDLSLTPFRSCYQTKYAKIYLFFFELYLWPGLVFLFDESNSNAVIFEYIFAFSWHNLPAKFFYSKDMIEFFVSFYSHFYWPVCEDNLDLLLCALYTHTF